jgi:hypothetical protein
MNYAVNIAFTTWGAVMGAGRPKAELVLTEPEREQLAAWARRRKTAQALALRSQIVLACSDGAKLDW